MATLWMPKSIASMIFSIILLIGIRVVFLGEPSPTLAQASPPFELVVWPDKLWRAGGTNTQMAIALKGLNGFSGNVTVNVTGLPPAQGDGINGRIYCESNCNPAGVAIGEPPWTVPVVNDQWKMFSPGLIGPGDSTTMYNDQTYTLTVTASAAGYQTITKYATLYAQHQWEPPEWSGRYNLEGVPACAPINDGAGQWIRPSNKQTVTAGGSVTFTCSWRAPEDTDFQNEWVDGTSITFSSTHLEANPAYEPTITGSFSPPSAPFVKSQAIQWQGNTMIFDTSKDVEVTYTVQTTTQTPPGVYIFGLGSMNDTGFFRFSPDGVLTVLAAPTPTASQTVSATPTPTLSPSSTPTASQTSSPTVSSTASSSPSPSASPIESVSPSSSVTPSASPTPVTLVTTGPPPVDLTTAELAAPVTQGVLVPAAVTLTGVSLATLGVTIPLTGLTTGATTSAVSGFLSLFLMLWNAILEWLGLRKRRYPWGTVFDVQSDQPVELAIVRLKTADGQLLETRVTDRMGRYSFLTEPGSYLLETSKAGYLPITHATGSRYHPIYNGAAVAITARSHAIQMNIALRRETQRTSILSLSRFLQALHRPALFITLPLGLWNYSVMPSFGTAAIIVLTGLILLGEWLLITPRGYGLVLDNHHRPLQGVVLRLLRAEDSKVLATTVTDTHGRYTFLVRPGHYLLTLATPYLISPDWVKKKTVLAVMKPAGQILERNIIVTDERER